ncbi:fimbrial protein [Burkholderia stagnalis]|uniref:fimbrial protein n=2 Tax=Burkholderia stagnalis TaxID=1503054 RepID=UPI001E4E3E47|nr:fimbrial protein [Burkholderia stagnalis]
MFGIKNDSSATLRKISSRTMTIAWRTLLSGNIGAKYRRATKMMHASTFLLAVCSFWPFGAQCATFPTAFGEGRIAAPSNTATGAILARHYFTPQQICERDVCEVTRSSIYNKGSAWNTRAGPDVETTVDGLSARVLLDGVPMTSTTRQSVRSTIEVQLFRDSRTPKSGTLRPGVVNSYFTIFYKTGVITSSESYIYLSADVDFINGTCSVPNQTVNLSNASKTSFRGIGSTAGGRAFSLRLTNCPAGYNRVGYQVTPLNGPVSGIPGALKLRPDSTASGVGIKLSDAKTQLPLVFDRSLATPYNGSAAAQIDIPLNAEYVQTEEKITGGTVQAGALVLLDYQ